MQHIYAGQDIANKDTSIDPHVSLCGLVNSLYRMSVHMLAIMQHMCAHEIFT